MNHDHVLTHFNVDVLLKKFHQLRQVLDEQGFKFCVFQVASRDKQKLTGLLNSQQGVNEIAVFSNDNAGLID